MKYQVTFTKYETYEVEAPNPGEALELALDMDKNDEYSWMGSIDKFDVEEIKNEY